MHTCVASYINFFDNALYSVKLGLEQKTMAAAYEACYRKVKELQGGEAVSPAGEYEKWFADRLIEINESPKAENSEKIGAELFSCDEQFTVVWID